MKGKRQKSHWRGFVAAIGLACILSLLGAWALGWLNRDISVIGGDLVRAARSYLQVDSSSSDILPDDRPKIYYGEGRKGGSWFSSGEPTPKATPSGLSYAMQQHLKRGATLGHLQVIDGDVVKLDGRTLRLWGIDAPDLRTVCDRYGRAWRCGEEAAQALREFVEKQTIACYDRGTDRFGRPMAECYSDDLNLSEWMAGEGWAYGKTPYTSKFAMTAGIAQARQSGIWIDARMRDPKRWNTTTYERWQ